jgi:hypothetical protein
MKHCRHIKYKETALMTKDNPKSINSVFDEEIWVGDSGATTTDLTMINNYMTNIRPVKSNENMIMGNGNDICPSKVGNIIGKKVNKNGEDQVVVRIEEVMYSPKSRFNLFSLSKQLKKGWKLEGSSESIKLIKDKVVIEFDIKVETKKGVLYCMRVKRNPVGNETGMAGANDEKINEDKKKPKAKMMNIQTAHEKFGHMDEARTRAAAAHLGITIVREMLKPCKDCAVRKAKQKNVPQQSDHEQSSKLNEKFFLILQQ